METAQQNLFAKRLETFIFFGLASFVILIFPYLSKRGASLVYFEAFVALPTLIYLVSQLRLGHYLLKSPIFIFVSLFILYTTASSLWNENANWANPDDITKPMLYSFLFLAAVSISTQSTIARSLDYRHYTLAVFIVGIAATDSIIVHLIDHSITQRISPIGRLSHEVTGMYFYGGALLAALVLSRKTKRQYKLINVFSVLAISSLLFLSYTRSVWIACAVCMLVHFFLSPNRKENLIVYLSLLAFPLFVVALKFDVLVDVVYRNVDLRLTIWQSSLSAIAESPVWGHGNDHYNFVYTNERGLSYFPHNIILSSAYYGGLIAVFLYLACLYYGFRSASKHMVSNSQTYFAGLLLLLGVIALQFDGKILFTKPQPIWFIFLFPLGLLIEKSQTAGKEK